MVFGSYGNFWIKILSVYTRLAPFHQGVFFTNYPGDEVLTGKVKDNETCRL